MKIERKESSRIALITRVFLLNMMPPLCLKEKCKIPRVRNIYKIGKKGIMNSMRERCENPEVQFFLS